MKKFLSLILILIICFGSFVSCGNEESSSSESQESSSQNQTDGIVGYDEFGRPIIKTSPNQLPTYTVQLRGHSNETVPEPNPIEEYLSSPIIENFSDFTEFLINATLKTSIDEITETTFEDNIVIVIYRSIDARKNFQYYNFEIQDNNIYLSYEYTIFHDAYLVPQPGYVDFVVVPRESCDLAKVNTSKIYFKDILFHDRRVENQP